VRAGLRAQLVVNLATFARRYPHFRDRKRNGAAARFYGWDYAPQRSGAFYESIAGEALPRHPKFSIVVRSVGRLPLLRRALATIAQQTYAPIEVVLVEDGSDRGRSLAGEFPTLDVVYVPLPRNVGRSAAGNAALARASGELCNFLDEDDELYADHVEQLVAALVTRGGRVAYASAFELPSRIEDDVIVAEGEPHVVFPGPLSRARMMTHNQLPIQTVLFERSLYAEVGGFDEALGAQEDWHLWARYLSHVGNFTFVDKTTSRYRVPLDAERYQARRDWLEGERRKVQQMLAELRLDASFGELPDEPPRGWWLTETAKEAGRRAYHGVRIAVRDFLFPER
jgi:glycosyltransferase involved in cell wall biosynthesis